LFGEKRYVKKLAPFPNRKIEENPFRLTLFPLPRSVYLVFVTGTAGSGKSLLSSVLINWYLERGNSAVGVNLDPGAVSLPYSPEVDIRDLIDIDQLMQSYNLGPNGALVLASDLIATRLDEVRTSLEEVDADYAIVDTPGQVELFAFRESGPYTIMNLPGEERTNLFLFDSTLVSSPSNFVSITFLSVAIQLRLQIPQISVLAKRDIVGERVWKKIMKWSSDLSSLENALGEESKRDYLLSSGLLRNLAKAGFGQELFPVSAQSLQGMVELAAAIGRQLSEGEEFQD
jgi:GTPase SAR1 family protein